MVAAPSLAIDAWSAQGGPMWPRTEAELKQHRVDAIVWWQGESDQHTPGYDRRLRDVIGRMRTAARNPNLRVVIVRVLDKREFAQVRQAQEQFVAGDGNAVLVSTDGLGRGSSNHLTETGYAMVASRIRGCTGRGVAARC
jgi:hypothetical protein